MFSNANFNYPQMRRIKSIHFVGIGLDDIIPVTVYHNPKIKFL